MQRPNAAALGCELFITFKCFPWGDSSAPTVSSPVTTAGRAQTWKGSRNSSRSL